LKDKVHEQWLAERLGDQILAVVGDWRAEHELSYDDSVRLEFLVLMGMLNTSPMMNLLAGVVKIEEVVQ